MRKSMFRKGGAQSGRFWRVQEPSNFEVFFKGVKSAGSGSAFPDFSDFLVPLGIQNGFVFGKKGSF